MTGSSSGQIRRDPYRSVVLVLLAMALLGGMGATAGGVILPNPLLLDAAVALALSCGILSGVAIAQSERARPPQGAEDIAAAPTTEGERPPAGSDAGQSFRSRISIPPRLSRWYAGFDWMRRLRVAIAGVGAIAITLTFPLSNSATAVPNAVRAMVAIGLCLAAAGLAFTAARYLADLGAERFPESRGLCRAARVLAWILIAAALSIGLQWMGQRTAVAMLHLAVAAVNIALCLGLAAVREPEGAATATFPLGIGVLSLLGSRTNLVASVLDAAQRQLGIDLRSTWALTVVRRSTEPLAIALCLLGWLSTSLTVVRVDEQGLVERLGVPVRGEPLAPGLHLHWPWPIDRVFRIPVRRVQALTVGHEGEEEGGPENVLWARQHAANEYTLLLGNGRDLITVDAAVQFRISDPRAWWYHCQNPAAALRAIAYRAVMSSTVNRTLNQALSENLMKLTQQMRNMVQREADALGLGVEVVAFTVGGLHPPVMVASDYQAVVSAQLAEVTAAVDAEVFRNQTVPAAEAEVVKSENAARSAGADARARATGEAWSFRTLQAQVRAAPEEYRFRRRLETLESRLAGRHFTIVDSRIQRDGGELWLLP